MKDFIKNGISFILPVIVLVLVPMYIERDISIKNILTFVIGINIMCVGLYTMIMTIKAFIQIGIGTLAPWNPTKELVTDGIYGYVRNPMILGVLTVLAGESIALLSMSIFYWAILFFITNNFYFVLYEEPYLERKFGDKYMKYKMNVRRWIPGLKPYNNYRGMK